MANILILNRKGGSGKTTISDELMFSLERSQISSAFIDLDQQQTSTHKDSAENVYTADVLVIDTPGALSDHAKDWVADADVVVIPTNPSGRDIPMLLETLETARTYGPKARRVIIVNRFTRYTASQQFLDVVREIQEEGEDVVTINQSEVFQKAFLNHRSVIDESPKSVVALKTLQAMNAIRSAADLPPDPTDIGKIEEAIHRREEREKTLKEIHKERQLKAVSAT